MEPLGILESFLGRVWADGLKEETTQLPWMGGSCQRHREAYVPVFWGAGSERWSERQAVWLLARADPEVSGAGQSTTGQSTTGANGVQPK